VRDLLHAYTPDLPIQLVHMTTTGDRVIDKPLPEIGGKGLFTQELEHALRAGDIDLAVHSLKDLPTEMPPEFVLGAILPRAMPFDALVSRAGYTVQSLPPGAVIGTSSLRRRAQLLAFRVLAVAGLERLERHHVISEILNAQIMLPAPGQGAIAVQCRSDDSRTRSLLAALDDHATRVAVTAERAFLQHLDAGCRLPVSAFATLDGDTVRLTGRVSGLDGTRTITVQGETMADDPASLGMRLAEDALAQGAGALLDEIRGELPA